MDGTVWLPLLCGNRSQYDAFWSPSLTLETANPDLPLCFQKTVLLWIPAGWMWLAAPYETFTLWTRPSKHGVWACSKLNFIKTFCSVSMAVTSVLSLTLNIMTSSREHIPPIDPLHNILRVLTMETYTEPEKEFTLEVVYFAFLAVAFVASVFADTAALEPSPKDLHGERGLLLPAKRPGSGNGKKDNPIPELRASFWMRISFQWMLPTMFRGYRRTVQFEDLFDVRPDDVCDVTIPTYQEHFTKTTGTSSGSGRIRWAFYKALFHTAGWPVVVSLFPRPLYIAFAALSPQLLRLLLEFIQSGDPYTWKGFVLATMLFTTTFLNSVIRHNIFYMTWNAGPKARSVVNAVVYRKALRLTNVARRKTTVGEMVNYLSVDAQKIQELVIFGAALIDIPLQVALTSVLIWYLVGWAALVGLALLITIVPVNAFYFGNQVRKLQEKQMKHKDSRLKIVNEILDGIKILKLYAWEGPFQSQVKQSRDKEVEYLRRSNMIGALSHTVWCIIPYLVALAVFAVFVLTSEDHVLNANIAFVTVSYINTLQMSLSILPLCVTFAGQGVVSARRVARFLELSEIRDGLPQHDSSISDAVQIDGGTFSWEPDGRPVLNNINISARPGQLVAVVGHVGAGKSSLLSAMLGEMVSRDGTVWINGTPAYVPQQAWIQNTTLRENILFEQLYSSRRYREVLQACSLEEDLEMLPGGDLTEIGVKGINLSGGQKQRVSLARAVYQDEDIYLLDDPLSAVDAHVGKHIFDNVIGNNGLLKDKTRILVTHGITFLPDVDLIVVLRDGHVTEIGQYSELLESNGDFSDFLRTYVTEDDDRESSNGDFRGLRRHLSTRSRPEPETTPQSPRQRKHRRTSDHGVSRESTSSLLDSLNIAQSKLIQEETYEEGKLKYSVIWTYVRAGGILPFCVIICSQLLFVGGQVATNLWLGEWTGDVGTNGTISREHANYRLAIYGSLGLIQTFAACILMITSAIGCAHASRNVHDILLHRILRAPMAFFDTTPVGRIMNRVSKDLDMLDACIPVFLRGWLLTSGAILTTIILISYSTPIFLVALAVLVLPYVLTQRVYVVYASQLKRIDAVRRSPIYTHFEETVAGATSIRAYRRQGAFIAKADQFIDDSQKSFYTMSAVQRWLGISIEALGSLVLLLAAILAVSERDRIGAGLAGVSITSAMQITNLLTAVIRASTELETYMVAMERIDEYSNADSEAPWELPEDQDRPEWPEEGAITFSRYGTRYRPGLDLVLRAVDLMIKPGEKIGVVGRTGAGKSSLTLALFRIIEAAEGTISIDGENISNLGLRKLRSRLTVIPQDPVMFSGTLRVNLDPFGRHSDLEVLEALEHAHLKDFVDPLREGIYYNCGEGGAALSLGQRQLVCLARALLRRSKVLVLDEATAAVDLETDALIQVSIRKHFKECTVITVAHRLNTVLDYDRILVLDKGHVKEFDSPVILLQDRDSIYYRLAKEAGLTH